MELVCDAVSTSIPDEAERSGGGGAVFGDDSFPPVRVPVSLSSPGLASASAPHLDSLKTISSNKGLRQASRSSRISDVASFRLTLLLLLRIVELTWNGGGSLTVLSISRVDYYLCRRSALRSSCVRCCEAADLDFQDSDFEIGTMMNESTPR